VARLSKAFQRREFSETSAFYSPAERAANSNHSLAVVVRHRAGCRSTRSRHWRGIEPACFGQDALCGEEGFQESCACAEARSDGNTRLYTDEDLERLEVILDLTRKLGVNLAGVEIILNMREKMLAMERQMREFVDTLNEAMADRRRQPESQARTSLIPFVRAVSVATPKPARGRSSKGSAQRS